jgi:hypothetical protein
MKVLFYNPAAQSRRFVPFEAIKGSVMFRRPHYDALRLGYMMLKKDCFQYYDESIEERPKFDPDIVVAYVPLNLSSYVASTIRTQWGSDACIVAYGPFPTLFPDDAKHFSTAVVKGDIVASWKRLAAGFRTKHLMEYYDADHPGGFETRRGLGHKYGFTNALAQLRTSFGCACSGDYRDYCQENVLYPHPARWSVDEAVNEVARIEQKIIYVVDDDFMKDHEFAMAILSKCWRYKKMWIFQTSGDIFRHKELLPPLRECGVRLIYLKHDWLGHDLCKSIWSREFTRQKNHDIHMIHGNRMTACCKLRLGFDGEDRAFYKYLPRFLNGIKIDLIEVEVQTPLPRTGAYRRFHEQGRIAGDMSLYDHWMPVVTLADLKPHDLYTLMELVRDRFYSWDSIIRRNLWVSQKLGLYNTLFFYLLSNLSYRGNFLEKVGYPP